MLDIALTAVPNQSLTVDLEGARWTITVRAAVGCMLADVTIDGVAMLTGTRVLAGEPVIPYGYLQDGNLLLVTEGGDLPDYAQFGQSQRLVYLTNDEMT